MTYTEDELRGMLTQAYEMPHGPAQIALVEQIIGHADANKFGSLSFDARMWATTAYVFGGEPAKAFVTFSWCLTEYDRDPARYDGELHSLLWDFKIMVDRMTRFPEIPLDRTYQVLDDMRRRFADGGFSPHAVYANRHETARHVGDLAAAEEWFGRWLTAPRDDLSDCHGCDLSSKAFWLASQGRDEEAIALAEPVLNGQVTCDQQPQLMLTDLMAPYLRTGRLEQAREAHRRAYRMIAPNLADLGSIATHIEFCALTGNEARGVEILERHLGWLDRAPTPHAAMRFAAAAALLLRRVGETSTEPVLIRRPAHDDRPAAAVSAVELGEHLRTVALDLAARFDARNASTYQTELMEQVMAARPLVASLPISVTAVRQPSTGSGLIGANPKTTTATGSASSQAPQVWPIPDDAGPDELLDLAERHLLSAHPDAAYAVFHAFDDRYALTNLTVSQRARRADGHGIEAAYDDRYAEAETAWTSAAELFGEAGDDVRRAATRARLARLWCGTGRAEAGLDLAEEAASYLLARAPQDRWCGALLSVAVGQLSVRRAEDVLSTLDRAEQYLEFALDATMSVHVELLRSRSLAAMGQMDDAKAAAGRAVETARALDFAEGIAQASALSGFIAEEQGDPHAALAAYDDALAAGCRAGLAMQVRMHRAALLAHSDHAAQVVDELVDLVAAHTAAGDAQAAAQARHMLATACLNADRELDAAEVAEEALAFFVDRPDANPDQVMALRHLLATSYVRLGQHDQAIAQLERISTMCQEQSNFAGVGQMAEEVADILDRLDRDAAAASMYLRAAESFAAAELPVDDLRNRRRHAVSLMWSGDQEGAVAALRRADEFGRTIAEDSDEVRWEKAMLLFDGARILGNVEPTSDAAIARMIAAAELFRAVGAHAQAGEAQLAVASLSMEAKDPATAAAAAKRALDDFPTEADDRREIAQNILDAAKQELDGS